MVSAQNGLAPSTTAETSGLASRLKLRPNSVGISIASEMSFARNLSSISRWLRSGRWGRNDGELSNSARYARLSGVWSRSRAAKRMFSTSVVIPNPNASIRTNEPTNANASRTGSRRISSVSRRL